MSTDFHRQFEAPQNSRKMIMHNKRVWFQYSFKSLIIAFFVVSVATGIAVSWVQTNKLAERRATKHVLELGITMTALELREKLSFSFWMPKEQKFLDSDELSVIINEVIDKTGNVLNMDLVNIKLKLVSERECELRIMGGVKSKEFVDILTWRLNRSNVKLTIFEIPK